MICATLSSKRERVKCRPCISYVIPPKFRMECDTIEAANYCLNPKSPYFMRTPAGRCDYFSEESEHE